MHQPASFPRFARGLLADAGQPVLLLITGIRQFRRRERRFADGI
ncbi:MAG: hypothetical protein AAFX65_11705 [Cyanobacteria bacterium J06638_7]